MPVPTPVTSPSAAPLAARADASGATAPYRTDWSAEQRVHRLVDGAFAFDTADGRHLVTTPAGEFIELALDEASWNTLRDVLIGTRPPAGLIAGPAGPDSSAVWRALDALAAEQLLVAGPNDDRRSVDRPTSTITVVGDSPVADVLVGILTVAAVATERVTAGLPEEATSLVVACADWLPDAAWQELDRWCAERAVCWHRSWREGGTVWIGPLTVPDRTASYADLRLRRLAASSWPDELEASWAHLDPADVAPPRWDRATVAVVAGALAADLLTFSRSGVDRTAAAWRGYDLATRAWHAHPVLPIPAGVRV